MPGACCNCHVWRQIDELMSQRWLVCIAQMAALQVHAEYGPGLDTEDPEGFAAALERFITRQVLMTRPKDEWRADIASRWAHRHTQQWPPPGAGAHSVVTCTAVARSIFCSAERSSPISAGIFSFWQIGQQWCGGASCADCCVTGFCRYKVLAQQTKEDARCSFMRILRTLPYGNATFFAVRRIGESAQYTCTVHLPCLMYPAYCAM